MKPVLKFDRPGPSILKGVTVEDLMNKPVAVDITKPPPEYPFRVHVQIRHTAKEFAGAFWDGQQLQGASKSKPYEDPRSVTFRKHWPKQKLYVLWNWPLFVNDARSHLTDVMARPSTPEYMKTKISEALTEEYYAFGFTPQAWTNARGR